MELIYFILGVNLGLLTYSSILGYKNSKKILERENEARDIWDEINNTNDRYIEAMNLIESVDSTVADITSTMEQDNYVEKSELTKQVEELRKGMLSLANKANRHESDTTRSIEVAVSTLSKELTNLQGQINAVKEDPNFLSRY